MISHNLPRLGDAEVLAAERVIRSAQIVQGKEVEAFENEFCSFIELPDSHAVALSSCTAALFMALYTLKLKGRYVAFPAYVCSSLRHAVAMAGAYERVHDVNAEFPNMDCSGLDGVDGIILPHIYGVPMRPPNGYSGVVIEDCAQSLGSRVDGVLTGLLGDVGVFSFYATKLMTTGGQGGMLVSKNRDLVDAVRDYREFDGRRDQHKRFNFQMTDLQAAIGRVQLQQLPGFLKKREAIYTAYNDLGLDLLDGAGEGIEPVRYRSVWKVDNPYAIIKYLYHKSVKAIIPIEDWELLVEPEQCPNADRWTHCTVSLPTYPALTPQSSEHIKAAIEAILEGGLQCEL